MATDGITLKHDGSEEQRKRECVQRETDGAKAKRTRVKGQGWGSLHQALILALPLTS